jgi:D-alanyl-D-alanine carboxypeptidase
MSLDRTLQRKLDALVAKGKVPHVVLGVDRADGSALFRGAAGAARPAGEALRPDSPFFIASVTKLFTAVVTLRLAERGALDLADPLSAHLPASLLAGLSRYGGDDHTSALTVEHLLSQTSGLADYFEQRPRGGQSMLDALTGGEDRSWDVEQAVAIAKQLPCPAPPLEIATLRAGKGKAHYADTNYQLLGAVLEAASGVPLGQLFHDEVLDPLALDQSYLWGHTEPRSGDTSAPAALHMRGRALTLDHAMRSFWADGGLVSTVDDCLRFLRALFAGALFAKRLTLPSMQVFRPLFFPLSYGLGMMRFRLPRVFSPLSPLPALLGHAGASGSFAFACPDARGGGLLLAGTVDQVAQPRHPFQLMLSVVRAIEKAGPKALARRRS